MLEIDIEEDACEQALKLGVTNFKVKAAGNRGWPDRCFIIPGGRPLFVEFKRPGKEPEVHQDVIINRLKYYGYDVTWCDTAAAAVKVIKQCLRRSNHASKLRTARLPEKSH